AVALRRLPGVADLDLHPHRLPDRVREQGPGDDPVGVELHDTGCRSPPDHPGDPGPSPRAGPGSNRRRLPRAARTTRSGGWRARTADLVRAKDALSQLS